MSYFLLFQNRKGGILVFSFVVAFGKLPIASRGDRGEGVMRGGKGGRVEARQAGGGRRSIVRLGKTMCMKGNSSERMGVHRDYFFFFI